MGFPRIAATSTHTVLQSRTYRPSGFWAIALLIASIVLTIGGAIAIYFGLNSQANQELRSLLLIGIGLAFLVMGGYLVAELTRSYIVFTSDTIEVHHLTSVNKFHRSELLGWRVLPTSPPALVLVPNQSKTNTLKIALIYRFDEFLDSWLEPLPNLDSEQARRIQNEIKADEQFGLTESERIENLKAASRVSRLLNISAGVVTIWVWIYPRPYNQLIFALLVLPFISLAAIRQFPRLIRIDHQRSDPRPSIGIGFMFPGFGLMLRGISDVHLFTWSQTVALSLAVALAVCSLALIADASVRSGFVNMLFVYLILIPYGFGSVMELNSILDRSKPIVYSARVLSKEISVGKHTDYRLYLESWELKQGGGWESVPPGLFRTVRRQDMVCMPVRQGAFHISWYVVTSCP